MSKLFVLLAFIIAPALALANGYKRTNCHPDSSNVSTCTCEIGNADFFGYAQFACAQLGCEEFESSRRPSECVTGMRGITCWVAQVEFTCTLMIPRADATIKTPDVCQRAVDDINRLGPASGFYNNLDYARCTYAGMSQPPFSGWRFTGSFEDGWR